MTVTCPYCGEFEQRGGNAQGHPGVNCGDVVCPRCDMTAAEHAYRARILADSAAVYAREHREFQARRALERAS